MRQSLGLAALCLVQPLACSEPATEDVVYLPTEELLNGKADAAAGPRVEIKVTLPEDEVALAVQRFKLTEKRATKRDVTFYDDWSLSLFDAGLVLRSREVKDGADDSTAKVRPLEQGDVDPSWFELDGFKCEEDRVGTRRVPSCSLTEEQDAGEIDAVADGDRPVDKLFSENQEIFADGYGTAVDWDWLVPLGPTATRVWKLQVKGFRYELTFERWYLPDGELLEVSCKVSPEEADAAHAELDRFLSAKGFDVSETQETKTRRALEAYAAEL